MTHFLAQIIDQAEGFVLIGDSSQDRFPGFSYNAYTKANKRFYCLDMGGLRESRGPTKGGKVYASIDELPEDHDDLAILWVKPRRSTEAVELAHEAGCKRVWFSFHTAHPKAIERVNELGMEVVEVGRCPIYYLDGAPLACRMHAKVVALSGTAKRPPQLTLVKDQRIML
ncbi:MAG: CoA-binding protein [Myxococcota bacterium]